MPKKHLTKVLEDLKSDNLVRTVTLFLTEECNLNCNYCYEKNDKRKRGGLSLVQIKDILSHHLNAPDKFDKVVIEFFGGEPFLEFETLRDTVKWATSQKWPKRYYFNIATNGTIMTDEIKEFLLKYKHIVQVGYSLDGTQEAHNLARSNSYDLVAKNVPFFAELWPNNPAKMTICAETIPYLADSIIDMEEKGIFFSANVVFEDIWGDELEKKELLAEYEKQLYRLVEYYLENPHLFPPDPLFRRFPKHLRSEETCEDEKNHFKNKRFCGSGIEMIAYDVDGNSYPCHRFVPVTSGKIPQKKLKLENTPTWMNVKCNKCDLLPVCPSCIGFNWEINDEPYKRTTFHCEALALEVIARCKYEAGMIEKIEQIDSLSLSEKQELKLKVETLRYIEENGFYIPLLEEQGGI